MEYKWIGAILVIGGCGGFGFSVAGEAMRQERQLRQLLENLDFMESELRYRLTALPELFASGSSAEPWAALTWMGSCGALKAPGRDAAGSCGSWSGTGSSACAATGPWASAPGQLWRSCCCRLWILT